MKNHTLQHVLVIRTDRMGDVLLSAPVLTAIKSSFPQCRTAMLVTAYTFDLMSGHPDIDELLFDDLNGRNKGFFGLFILARDLKKHRFNASLLLHPTLRLALACRLAGIPVRVGTAFRFYSFLFNRKVKQRRKFGDRHELDYNMEIAAAIGVKTNDVEFKFYIPAEAENKVASLLTKNNIQNKYIVLHPGSGGSARDWPPEKFGELAARIKSELGLPVCVTGSADEAPLIDRIEKTAGKLMRFDGQLSIKELAALLKNSALVVANSTGPLHLAVTVGAEVIGLYCTQTACGPDRWGPYNRENSVLTPPPGTDYNNKNINPMELISVNYVLQLAKEKLAK